MWKRALYFCTPNNPLLYLFTSTLSWPQLNILFLSQPDLYTQSLTLPYCKTQNHCLFLFNVNQGFILTNKCNYTSPEYKKTCHNNMLSNSLRQDGYG